MRSQLSAASLNLLPHLYLCAGKTQIMQREYKANDLVYALGYVNGPVKTFNAEMTADTGSSCDLSMSARKAEQIGLPRTTDIRDCELAVATRSSRIMLR